MIHSPTIVYSPKSDCFVTYTSEMRMECYKYSTLATQPSAADSGSKKLTADWSVVVGEQAVEVIVSRLSKALASSQASPPRRNLRVAHE